jgi:hypothetical protein
MDRAQLAAAAARYPRLSGSDPQELWGYRVSLRWTGFLADMNLLGQQRTACRSGGIGSLLSIDHLDESGMWLIKDAGDGRP